MMVDCKGKAAVYDDHSGCGTEEAEDEMKWWFQSGMVFY